MNRHTSTRLQIKSQTKQSIPEFTKRKYGKFCHQLPSSVRPVPICSQWRRARYLPCSLADIKVKASISQTFINDNANVTYEALYRFPLYENSAVCGFEMEHSGRKILGVVQGEKEAIQTYKNAKTAGKNCSPRASEGPRKFSRPRPAISLQRPLLW